MSQELGDFIEASGLLTYDPKAIARIYRGSPFRLLRRLWQTLIPIGLFLIQVGWDKLCGLLEKDQIKNKRAKELTELLVELGPAFIKAGQALSTRPDIIPRVVLEELAKLQDQLPGFDSNLAMACIEEDLKSKVNNIFSSLDAEPISAASLGQVHKGILINGQKVAVKVQRPGLREQITLDLYIVRNLAYWFKKYIKLIRSDLVALIDELGKRVFEEMDYINEANNAEKFRELHQHNPKIAVPKIFKEYTSRRVLTMEWVEGVKLTNLEKVRELGIDPNEMIDVGVNCSLEQLLEHGFFHADPHPGNLLAMADARLCYLDFGMMSEVNRESRTALIQAVVHLVNKDFSKLSEDFVNLGFLSEKINLKPIIPAFEKVFTQAIEMGVEKMDFKSVTDDMSNVMYKFPFRVPPYYALIIRSLVTLEGIALSVDSNFKILGAAYPYFARRLMEDDEPELRESLKEMVFSKQSFQWERINDLVASAASESKLNIELLLDQLLNFIFSAKGAVIRQELVKTIVKEIDIMTWSTLKRSSKNTKMIKENRNLMEAIKNIPGFKKRFILKKIPTIIKEPEGRKMGYQLIAGLAERGVVRLVKIASGVTT